MARFISLAALAFHLPAPVDDPAAKAELEKLAGTWRGVAVSRDGTPLPKADAEAYRLVVAADGGYGLTAGTGEDAVEGTYKLDPTTKPKEIDATRTGGARKGEKLLGVYVLSGDAFVACFVGPGKDRPKVLNPAGGPGLTVLGFQREKK